MRVNDIARAAGAAAAAMTAVVSCQRLHARTVTTQQHVDRASSHSAVTRHWTARRVTGDWRDFEAVYVQIVTQLMTDSHGKVQQICTAEYLQQQSVTAICLI